MNHGCYPRLAHTMILKTLLSDWCLSPLRGTLNGAHANSNDHHDGR
jgi:hypothetical protein